ncbi:hypothetical protein GGD38_006856 [Chitinophagaceae bacterium OAS944]|nr:hypothetical protein [Chitinophagaceae bacterium OAS944]
MDTLNQLKPMPGKAFSQIKKRNKTRNKENQIK